MSNSIGFLISIKNISPVAINTSTSVQMFVGSLPLNVQNLMFYLMLPRLRDVAEKDQKVKIPISYIFSSQKVFLKLINILIYYSSYRK